MAGKTKTAKTAAYVPGGDATRVTRRREESSGEIDEAKALAWLEGRRALREQREDADEAATEALDDEGDWGEDDPGDEGDEGEAYALADADGDDDGDRFDKMSDTHGPMTCADHSHGKYADHSHDGDADHSEAPLKDDGEADDESDELAEPGDDDGEEYDEADGDGDADADDEEAPEPQPKPAKKAARGRGRSSKKASEGSPRGGRVADEAVTLAEQAKRLAEVEAKAKRLEEANAQMAFQLYETEVGKTLAGWQNQTFQFKEGTKPGKDGKLAPVYRSGRIALSRVFREQYRAFMLHEGLRLGSATRKKLNELLESAFTGVVDLTARGGSFDQEARTTRGGNAGRRPADAATSDRLQEVAERIAQQRGKTLAEIASDAELFAIYELAEREVGYR